MSTQLKKKATKAPKSTKPSKPVKTAIPENIINDAPKLHSTFEVGDVAHQGDVMFVAIAELPKSAKVRVNRQLADGNTQGSRHVLERGDVYDCVVAETAKAIKDATGCTVTEDCIGPVIVSPAAPTENDVSHPEHGNQGFPAGTICAIVYQRNQDALERAQRTRD